MKRIIGAILLTLLLQTTQAQVLFTEDFQSYQGFGDTPTGGWSTSGVGGYKVYIRTSGGNQFKYVEIALGNNKRGDSLTTPSFGPLTENAVLTFNSRLLDSYIGTTPGFRHIITTGDKVSAYITTDGTNYTFLQDLLPGYPTSGVDFGNFSIPLNGFSGSTVRVKFVTTRTQGEMIPCFDNFVATNVTGTKNLKIGQNLSLFPNPSTNGRVQISAPAFSSKAQLEIFNILGTKVFSAPFTEDKASYDLSHLRNGVYLVKVSEGNQAEVTRLVLR